MRGWGWAPWWLPVTAVLLLGVPGGPRCPIAVSAAVGAVVHRYGRRRGPPAFLTCLLYTSDAADDM
eukprot:676709-Alexandrium_andersonii.AAC.1